MDKLDLELLKEIADLHDIPEGSYNIRKNGKALARNSTSEIEIEPKTDKSGIDIYVKPNVVGKSCHIPVIVTEANLTDVVYNDFHIGEGADVVIIAGCGISCSGEHSRTEHSGIHTFYLEKNCKVRYVEKHLGVGANSASRVLNPETNVFMAENSYFEMETTQIRGVQSSERKTTAKLGDGAKLMIKEKILTTDDESATTSFTVYLDGKKSSVDVLSRSVAKDNSYQGFVSHVIGNNDCFGHVECDGIVVGAARITSDPKISANNVNSSLVHEAAIGKIAGEQLVKLMSLGLSAEQAEELIIKGFLS